MVSFKNYKEVFKNEKDYRINNGSSYDDGDVHSVWNREERSYERIDTAFKEG